MARQYIGARYVPKFYVNSANTSEWTAGVEYEPLTVVTYNGNSYTSKTTVPATVGNPSLNPSYWVISGVYNAQLGQFAERLDSAEASIADLEDDSEKLFWYTPEMFGAAGDGVTDDAAAIQAMFNAMSEYDAAVFSGRYICRSQIRITQNNIRLSGGFTRAEYNPVIKFEVSGTTGLVITGSGIGVSNLVFRGTGASGIETFLIELDASLNDGNIDAIFTDCAFFSAKGAIVARGRNVNCTDCMFSTLALGLQFETIVGLTTEYRGFILQGCRVHAVNTLVNSLLQIAGADRGIMLLGNYMDYVGTIFTGYSGGIVIRDNVVHRYTTRQAVMINLMHNENDTTGFYDDISDNIFHGNQEGNSRCCECRNANLIFKNNHVTNFVGYALAAFTTAKIIVENNTIELTRASGNAIECAYTVTGLIKNNTLISSGAILADGCTKEGNVTI